MQNSNAIRTRTRATAAAPAREVSWSFMLLVILCAAVVAAGFFFAARQHFTSMEYGLKNSKLREQVQNLEAEKRRLLLAREVAISPVAIRKAARGLGLTQAGDEPAIVAAAAKPASPKVESEVATNAKPETVQPKSSNQTVIKTTMTAPVARPNPSTGETRMRVADTSKERKEKTEVAALLKLR